MTGVALGIQVECFPCTKQEEQTVAVVVCILRTRILQLAAMEDGDKEMLCIKADINIALLCICGDRTTLLQGRKTLQQLCINTAHLHIWIAFLHYMQNALVKAEKHNDLKRREYLILHVCHIRLPPWEAKAIKGQHITLAEMLQRNKSGLSVHNEFYALEPIVHQVGLVQSLPQHVCRF